MSAQDDIDRVLGGEEPAYSDTPESALPEEYRRASQYLYRLRQVRLRRLEAEALYDDAIEELYAAKTAALDPLKATEEWLEQALALWHHARRAEDPTLATILLPAGRLESSNAQDRWEYPDPKAFIKWAHEHELADAVRQPPTPGEEVAKSEARKALDGKVTMNNGVAVYMETGETIPGLVIRPGGDYELGRHYRAKT